MYPTITLTCFSTSSYYYLREFFCYKFFWCYWFGIFEMKKNSKEKKIERLSPTKYVDRFCRPWYRLCNMEENLGGDNYNFQI